MTESAHSNVSVSQFYTDASSLQSHVASNVDCSHVNTILEGCSDSEFLNFFDVTSTIEWIEGNSYTRVALQFPDNFIRYSLRIVQSLENSTSAKVFILADTSYRSCCVDEVAAAHSSCDALVHYGDACLSAPTQNIPVRYVLGKLPFDSADVIPHLVGLVKDGNYPSVLLVADAPYSYCIDHLSHDLAKNLPAEVRIFKTGTLMHDSSTSQDQLSSTVQSLGRHVDKDFLNTDFLNRVVTVFVGDPASSFLPLWLMTHPQCCTVITVNPLDKSVSQERAQSTRQLRKRLFLVEKLRDANTVGLVVGSVGVKGHREAVLRMRELCKAAGKKIYVISVGKVNVPKLSNFADIDVFVLLSCPFGVMLDCSDHFRPVLSLFEAEVALNPDSHWAATKGWTAEFPTFIHNPIGQQSGDGADMSLITGKMRSRREEDEGAGGQGGQITLYTAGDYFAERSWRGLDDAVRGGDSVEVTEGRSGIAVGYTNEETK